MFSEDEKHSFLVVLRTMADVLFQFDKTRLFASGI